MKALLTDSSFSNVDLTELPTNSKFVRFSNHERKISLHLKAIKRKRELIGKLMPEGLLRYLSPPQEVPREEHNIASPPKALKCTMIIMLVQPAVRK